MSSNKLLTIQFNFPQSSIQKLYLLFFDSVIFNNLAQTFKLNLFCNYSEKKNLKLPFTVIKISNMQQKLTERVRKEKNEQWDEQYCVQYCVQWCSMCCVVYDDDTRLTKVASKTQCSVYVAWCAPYSAFKSAYLTKKNICKVNQILILKNVSQPSNRFDFQVMQSHRFSVRKK